MKSDVARFLGNGNVWLGEGPGRHRGWKLTCGSPNCTASKIMGSNKSQSLPPDVIAKKLRQSGWFIGTSEERDRCPQCVGKQKRARDKNELLHKAFAAAAARDERAKVRAPIVEVEPEPEPVPVPATPLIDLGAEFFNQMHDCLTLARQYPGEMQFVEAALNAIERARDNANWRLKRAVRKVKEPKPAPTLPDADYEKWLAEQD